jgi:1-acyl-sn-glycerol-3-phosphate acyltransferase
MRGPELDQILGAEIPNDAFVGAPLRVAPGLRGISDPAPWGFRFIHLVLRLLVRLFFRRVDVVGLHNLPTDRGGILVAWHPNGLVDPGLILTCCPRRVVFGARHGLFRWPLLGRMMKEIGTVPIYRTVDDPGADAESRRRANHRSLDALAGTIAGGALTALFPEGVSHDAPHPMELKTGAARLFYRARALAPEDAPAPVIVPVGLHYDAKKIFRSRALVRFHPPMAIPEALDARPDDDEPEEVERHRVRALTTEVGRVLHEVVHATEDWETHHLLHRGRKLVRAERAARAGVDLGRPGMVEKELGFARIWKGYYARKATDPARTAVLRERVARYDRDLSALGLEDHDLDRSPRLIAPWLAFLLILQVIGVFLLLPPILLLGVAVNAPTAGLLILMARVGARDQKDVATIKVLFGAVLYPITWIAAGLLGGLAHGALHGAFPRIPDTPVLAGLVVALLSAIGGAATLRYVHVSGETARAVRVRLTRARRRRAIERLRAERAVLHDALVGMSQGLDLPGQVAVDGRVREG